MKSILKNKTNSIVALVILTVSIISLGIFAQGCSREDNSFLSSTEDESSFLNLEMPKDRAFSKEESEILNKAFQRIHPYMIIEDNTCYLTIHSPKAVNMSVSLFSLIEQSVANANMQYEMYKLFKEKDVNITIKNPFEINPPIIRLRASSELEYYGAYGYTMAYTLTDSEVTTVINALRGANGSTNAFVGLITSAFGGPTSFIATALISAYAYLSDSKFASIQNEYARSGSTSGITLREYTSTPPGYGVTFKTYSASF
ncbi:MAG TPA: hypothetical protein DIC46_03880 [Porphyromonadaceae bacterium]|jgi:hypothetical protein|nr:hypothetical protein [Porphyromonadaceae bacterium]